MVELYRENNEYCTFTPKPELVAFIGERPGRASFCIPLIWSAPRPGTGIPVTPEETIEIYKIVFLAMMMTHAEKASPAVQQLLKELLGEPPYTGETFDQWWTLTITGRGAAWQIVLKNLSKDSISQLLPASSAYIDSFLRSKLSSPE